MDAICQPNASPLVRAFVFWSAYAFLGLRQIWQAFAVSILGRPRHIHYMDEMSDSMVVQRTPSLFIYSDTDQICGADSIESFMGRLKRLGGSVEGSRLLGSPHCQHYRLHPVEYTRLVAHFMHNVIQFEA